MQNAKLETITLGAGCFWCVEAVFTALRGVVSVESGYANGNQDTVTYEELCTGTTGFVEVVRLEFDPVVISLPVLLDVFFATHDPTTFNRQGNDVGTQYRSGIYTSDNQQLAAVQQYVDVLKNSLQKDSGCVKQKPTIVTEVMPLTNYVTAESYHQRFFEKNPNQPYCVFTAVPKLHQLSKQFPQWLK